jgi:hypothetical protein
MNTDYMTSMMYGSNVSDATRELQQNKMKYCMHKDDLVIGLGRPTHGTSINGCSKKAYPSVITTQSGTHVMVRRWRALQNHIVSDYEDFAHMKQEFELYALTPPGLIMKPLNGKSLLYHINNMLDFHFVGVSLGLAYAHAHSGDTVGSVMVGGLKTVLNGGFQVNFVNSLNVVKS